MDTLWYRDGLRFRCTRCGNCCTGEPGYVWVSDEDLAALADYLGEPLEQVRKRYTKSAPRGLSLREKLNGDCVFWNRERGCTVYPARPPQCRTWPFWQSNVATPEDWEATRAVCPGAGQGELFSAEEISKRLKIIRL